MSACRMTESVAATAEVCFMNFFAKLAEIIDQFYQLLT